MCPKKTDFMHGGKVLQITRLTYTYTRNLIIPTLSSLLKKSTEQEISRNYKTTYFNRE